MLLHILKRMANWIVLAIHEEHQDFFHVTPLFCKIVLVLSITVKYYGKKQSKGSSFTLIVHQNHLNTLKILHLREINKQIIDIDFKKYPGIRFFFLYSVVKICIQQICQDQMIGANYNPSKVDRVVSGQKCYRGERKGKAFLLKLPNPVQVDSAILSTRP